MAHVQARIFRFLDNKTPVGKWADSSKTRRGWLLIAAAPVTLDSLLPEHYFGIELFYSLRFGSIVGELNVYQVVREAELGMIAVLENFISV